MADSNTCQVYILENIYAGCLAFSAKFSSMAVVSDLGRSMGWPRARAHTVLAVTPNSRLTPNITV